MRVTFLLLVVAASIASAMAGGGYTPFGYYTWKSPALTAATLPSMGNVTGDARTALDTFAIYVWNGSAWVTATTGTVTSVGLTVPAFLSVSGSPVTGSGTLAVTLSGTALPVANGGTGSTTGGLTATSQISTTGQLLVGSGTADNTTTASGLQVLGTTAATSSEKIVRYSADNGGSTLEVDKSRGASIGTLAVVTTADALGNILFRGVGTDAAAYSLSSRITGRASGTIGSAIVPGTLEFYTTTNAGTSTLAFTIDHTQLASFVGRVVPAAGEKGVSTNTNATAGNVGEYVESLVTSVTNVPGASGAWGDMTSISLTAGDWDVDGLADYTYNGATLTGRIFTGISTTAGNSATGLVFGVNETNVGTPSVTGGISAPIPSYRISLSGTTTIYFKTNQNYSVATPQYTCRISARRVQPGT